MIVTSVDAVAFIFAPDEQVAFALHSIWHGSDALHFKAFPLHRSSMPQSNMHNSFGYIDTGGH